MTSPASSVEVREPARPRVLLPTLTGYSRGMLVGDLTAALTLAAIALPEQMATAKLAGVAPQIGLFAFVAGCLAFALIGTHRSMSVGADSTIAPIIAAGAVLIAPARTAGNLSAVALLAAMVGVLLVIVGVAKLGWIAQFLSTPAVTGIFCGIAIQIVAHQLPSVFGLPEEHGTAAQRIVQAVQHAGQVAWRPTALGLGVLVVIVIGERISSRIPSALIGVVLATLAVAVFDLGNHGVAVVGHIDSRIGLADVTAWTPDAVWRLLPTALTIAFVCVVQTAATERAIEDPDASLDRDVIAVGVGGLLSAGVGGFSVDASPPRTTVIHDSRGRSQVVGLVAAAVVLAILIGASSLVTDLPEAALGGILLFVASRLLKVGELRRIWRFDKWEFVVAGVALVAVVVLGIEQAVVVAMALSLIDRTRRAARPRDTLMGREPGTDHWIPVGSDRPTEQLPGVIVYLVYGPLWYADATFVAGRIRHEIAAHDTADPSRPITALVLDVDAVSDIDYTAARTLVELAGWLANHHIRLALARASHDVTDDLRLGGLVPAGGAGLVYSSVADAVQAVTPAPQRP